MSGQAMGTRRFVGRNPTAPGPARGDAFVVAAGKGGVGTSTAALLLALSALRRGPVTLVDAQEGLAGVDRMLGADGEPGSAAGSEAGAASSPSSPVIRQVLAPGLTLVRVPGDDDPLLGAAGRRAALRRAARGPDGATVIVDAGARPVGVLHALADFNGELVTVLGPDGVSGPAAYALAKLVLHHRPQTRLAVLVNRADEAVGRLAYESVRTAARRFLDAPVEWLGHLPETPGLTELPLEGWLRLGEHEPALLDAAAQASARLLPRPAALQKQTLTLLK